MKLYKHNAVLPTASFEKLNNLSKTSNLINIIDHKKIDNCYVKVVILTTISQEEILNIIGFKPD